MSNGDKDSQKVKANLLAIAADCGTAGLGVSQSWLLAAVEFINQLERELAEEVRNKKQFERDWLEACDQIDALKAARPSPAAPVDPLSLEAAERLAAEYHGLEEMALGNSFGESARDQLRVARELIRLHESAAQSPLATPEVCDICDRRVLSVPLDVRTTR